MEKEIKKTKISKVAIFETLDSAENVLLKGGFSPIYDEKFVSGGKTAPAVANVVSGCDAIININSVKGCVCGPLTA